MRVEIDESNILAQGVQGRLYSIRKINGNRIDDYLAKIYYKDGQKKRIKKFIQYLNTRDLHSQPELSCLPCDYFKHRKTIGIVMKRAMGNTLENSYKALHTKALSERLVIAYQVARGMDVLHKAEIIHADVCSANIMIHGNVVQIIDVDGGGIPAKRIRPTIRGHSGGSWIAPEIFADASRLPTIESDRWSLAVVIHTIIIPKLDPLHFLEKYADIHRVNIWPPEKVGHNYRQILAVQKSYLRACEPVYRLLKITFNEGIHDAAKRIGADKLTDQLKSCLENIVRCGHCKREFVKTDQKKCPSCGRELIDIRLKLRNREISLVGHKAYLTTADFGGNNNANLLMLALNGNEIQVKLLGHIQIKHDGREITSDENLPINAERLNLIEATHNGATLQIVFKKISLSEPQRIKICLPKESKKQTQTPYHKAKLRKKRRRKKCPFSRLVDWLSSL